MAALGSTFAKLSRISCSWAGCMRVLNPAFSFPQPIAFNDSRRRHGNGVFGGGVHDGLRGGVPTVRLRDCGRFFEREARHAYGPGEHGQAAAYECDFQNWRAGSLLHGHAAPEAAFEFEVAAAVHAGIGLANAAHKLILAAAADPAAAIDSGPGEVESAAGLGLGCCGEQGAGNTDNA